MILQEKALENFQIRYADRNVKVTCTDYLKQYLASDEDAALALADALLQGYQDAKGEALEISRDSLAIELIAHVFIDELFSRMEQHPEHIPALVQDSLHKVSRKILASTAVIDCGSRAVDTNRFVWDMLVPFKGLIYSMAVKSSHSPTENDIRDAGLPDTQEQ